MFAHPAPRGSLTDNPLNRLIPIPHRFALPSCDYCVAVHDRHALLTTKNHPIATDGQYLVGIEGYHPIV